MNNDGLGSFSVAGVLWEFDRELADGGSPRWECYLGRCRNAAQRTELLSDMISSEIDHAGWDAKRLKKRLRFFAKHNRSKVRLLAVVRGLYADRIKADEHPSLRDFETFGLAIDKLQLRVEDEPLFLGYAVGGRYRLDQLVGVGRFGMVYRAVDLCERRQVAVKTIHGKDRAAKRQARALIKQESQALRVLRHSGIPEFIDLVSEAGTPCIVMKLVVGGTLSAVIQKGPLSVQRAATIVAEIADSLDHAHRKGYIHRDLTLSNVLVDRAGHPYLVDFGLALSHADQFDRDGESAGSFGYQAVESLLGMTSQMDGRTDIWSAGAILYELLTGLPLTGRTSREVAFVDGVVLGLRKLKFPKAVPKALRNICEKCLARDPNNRYHTAGLLRSALNSFLSGGRHVQI